MVWEPWRRSNVSNDGSNSDSRGAGRDYVALRVVLVPHSWQKKSSTDYSILRFNGTSDKVPLLPRLLMIHTPTPPAQHKTSVPFSCTHAAPALKAKCCTLTTSQENHHPVLLPTPPFPLLYSQQLNSHEALWRCAHNGTVAASMSRQWMRPVPRG
jgi:hypothetical protein